MSRKNWTNEKLFYRLLNNKSDKSHWENIRELRSRGTKEIFYKCVDFLNSENKKARLIGAEILSQLGLPPRPFIIETLELFFKILKTETDNIIISTIFYGIGHNNQRLKKEYIDFICTFKNTKNLEIKEGLVFALGGINNNLAIETLIGFTSDRTNSVRDWATFGLSRQITKDSPSIRQALWNRVNDKHQKTRYEAIFGLAIRKDERIKEIIKRELNNIDNFGSLLLEAIEELNDQEFIEILQEKLTTNQIEKRINPQWLQNTIDKLRST